jgi:hypothetical protein
VLQVQLVYKEIKVQLVPQDPQAVLVQTAEQVQ